MPNQPQNDVEESMPSSILPKVTDEIRAEYAENNDTNANNSKKKRPCLGGIPTIFCAILVAIAIAVTVVAVWISKNPAEPPSSIIDNNNTTSVSNAATVVSSKPLFIPWEDLEDENHFLHDWYNETKHAQQQQQLDDFGDTNEFLNDWDNETDDEVDIYVPPENNNCDQKLECLPCLLHRCFVDSGYLSTTENIWDAMGQGSLRPHPDSRDDCRKFCPFTEEECGQGALCGHPRDREGLLSCVKDIENVCVEEEPVVVEEEPTTATVTPSEDNNCEQKTECLPCLVHRCFYGREDDIDEACNETCSFTEEVCGQRALCGYPPDIKGLTYCIKDIEAACL